MRLEVSKEKDVCDIKMGTFVYDQAGSLVTADFYVKTCADDQGQKISDYNEQFTDEWEILTNSGAKNIKYVEETHNDIF